MRSLIFTSFLFLSSTFAAVNLDYISGSDFLLGAGTKAVSLGGAFTAVSDDPSAIFWNPAGLSRQSTNEVLVIGDSSEPSLDFAAITYHFNDAHHTTLSAAYNSRIVFRGYGDWGNTERARDLLDFVMLTYYMNFSKPEWQGEGGVDSKTIDYRIALSSQVSDSLNIGISYVNYRCHTRFYGAWQNNVCVVLKGQNMDAGLLYKVDESLDIGLSAWNIIRDSQVPIPYFISIGAFKKWHDFWRLSCDVQHIFGNNGTKSDINFWIAKTGVEYQYKTKHFFRVGLNVPLVTESSKVSNFKDKFVIEMIPSIGYGYSYKKILAEIAIFPNVMYAYVENKVVPEAKFSLTYKM